MKKQQVKHALVSQKKKPSGGGGIFEKGGHIPKHIKPISILSPTKDDMCRSSGGWGEPCR